jgi:mannose-1-phosphate guanylyltransferase/mannose-6-phosphate isomerase
MIIPVILAGGVGSRLWPLSRQLNPKQFIAFDVSADSDQQGGTRPTDGPTLFQSTLSRLQGLPELMSPVVICNEEHRFLAAEQLRQNGVAGADIVLEPCGRNTAPAVALAALMVAARGASTSDEPVLLVLPADHVIRDKAALHRCIKEGERQARAGNLVTFGITPDYPETGYGYIQRGDALEVLTDEPSSGAYQVAGFVEKPDMQTAEAYLADGLHYWNSGMFMFTASRWLEELQRLAPDMANVCREAVSDLSRDGDFCRVPEHVFARCRSDSIDYAVMEKTPLAVVIPLSAGWSDLGAWGALWEISDLKTAEQNVLVGDVHCVDVRNSYIRSGSRLVAAVGMENAVIVETADAVLVADRSRVQDVKKVVQWLEKLDRPEAQSHTLVLRPWGSYQGLAQGPGFQVKRIRVKPGAALSLQMHHHRAEHWVVTGGVATVTCDDRVFDLTVNESTFIPLGSRHRLENKTAEWIELIEVQTGSYLGEDDIVRFEDVYGRAPA